jgi:hypothetical protein
LQDLQILDQVRSGPWLSFLPEAIEDRANHTPITVQRCLKALAITDQLVI